MNLSNTAQYAIRVLSYMVIKQLEIYSALSLVNELSISDKYLRKLMTALTKAGLIQSVQGRYGGYVLSKSPDSIYLMDIISAVENKEKYEGCVLGFEKCSDDNPCALHGEWVLVRREMYTFLKENTLSHVVGNQGVLKF